MTTTNNQFTELTKPCPVQILFARFLIDCQLWYGACIITSNGREQGNHAWGHMTTHPAAAQVNTFVRLTTTRAGTDGRIAVACWFPAGGLR
jgi:hypothetical protein